MFFWGYIETDYLSVCVSVSVQNTTFCQSVGGGIESHSVTATPEKGGYTGISLFVGTYVSLCTKY